MTSSSHSKSSSNNCGLNSALSLSSYSFIRSMRFNIRIELWSQWCLVKCEFKIRKFLSIIGLLNPSHTQKKKMVC